MLIEETKKFKVDTEAEAATLIDTFKQEQAEGGYVLSKAGYTRKEIKSKGEVIGEVFTVTVTKKFE